MTCVAPAPAEVFPEPPPAAPPPAGIVVADFGVWTLGTLEGADGCALTRGCPTCPGPTVSPVRPATTKTAAATAENAAMAGLLVKIGFAVLVATVAGTAAALASGSARPKVREVKTSSRVA